jgi:hypothetical protein
MALTANSLPAIPPGLAVPFDAANDLSGGSQTLTATGYLGSPNQLDMGQGRVFGICALDITNMKVSATDEVYKFALLGSNDVSWANGNVELLAFHDFAALAANRQIATILGASPAIPPVGATGTLVYLPFTTLMQRIVYRYVRGYLVIAGTAPTITLRSWLAPIEMKL